MTAVCTHTHAHTCTRVGFLRTLTLVGLLAAPTPVLRCPRKNKPSGGIFPQAALWEDSYLLFSLCPCSENMRVNSSFCSPTLRPLLLVARCCQQPSSPRGTSARVLQGGRARGELRNIRSLFFKAMPWVIQSKAIRRKVSSTSLANWPISERWAPTAGPCPRCFLLPLLSLVLFSC